MDIEKDTLWDASLSSMWATGNFITLEDFFVAARRLGFARVELNHQVNSSMLAGIDLTRYAISSIHEPCPADISVEALKARDWLISATDEENRKQGVSSIKRSVDLASSLGIHAIVVHAGNVGSDWPLEKQLFRLCKAGQAGTPEHLELKNRLVDERRALVGPRLEAVKKSLVELLDYTQPTGIRLGLENRYHYMDIPILEEMGQLLSLGSPEQLGFWYDVGHAQTLDRLGFFPHLAWLQEYASRIIGIHLHDVVGVEDHNIPGVGEVDFAQVAGYMPAGAIHTLEIKNSIPGEQISRALPFIERAGCIRRL